MSEEIKRYTVTKNDVLNALEWTFEAAAGDWAAISGLLPEWCPIACCAKKSGDQDLFIGGRDVTSEISGWSYWPGPDAASLMGAFDRTLFALVSQFGDKIFAQDVNDLLAHFDDRSRTVEFYLAHGEEENPYL